MHVRAIRPLIHSTLFVLSLIISDSSQLDAAPITGGTGPGGIETTAGGAGTNLKLWYRAEDLQDSGGSVTQWLDASGNGYTATAGVDMPAFTGTGLNGLPAVRFTGATSGDQILTASGAAAGIAQNVQGVSMFLSLDHSQSSVSGNQVYLGISSGDGSQAFRSAVRTLSATSAVTVRSLDSDTGIQVTGGTSPATPMVAGGVIDYPVRDAFRYTNGTQVAANTNLATAATSTDNTPSDIISLGNIGPAIGGQQFLGDMGEVIVFNRAVNLAERTIIDNYLSSKFNAGSIISGSDRGLATGDRYAGDTTANGNYDFNVFGVGQAAGGSQVLSAGAAGFGIDLTGSSLSDNNWAFAGRNSLVNTNSLVTTDLTTAGVAKRWEREWYVDVTGAFGGTLAFNFDDADLLLPTGNYEYSLLYRSGTSGDFTDLGLASSLSGDTILFQVNSANLVDGYYTLGLTGIVPEPSSLVLLGLGSLLLVRRKRTVRRGC